MRGRALLVVLLSGCAAKELRVPLLHLNADSEETARDVMQAVREAGVDVDLGAVADLDEVPSWLEGEKEGWVLVGKAEDRKQAEAALAAYFAKLRESAKEPKPKATPFVLGTRKDVSDKEVGEIQAELARRRAIDQAVRTDRSRHGEMAKVDADNTAYLKKLLADIGWIDTGRFGQEASGAAFLIVQHSGDLPFMLAALPEIEKEVRAGKADAQHFALLYDRTQLMSGGKQRYGSQIRENEDGEREVYRLEDPDRVDEFRKALGLRPLKEYLALFGGDVKISR